MSDGLRGSTQYNYDPAGQLTRRVNTMDRQVEEFAWDAAGNLLDDAQRSSRGYVEGNRLLMWQDLRFEYDPFGNLATKLRGANQTQRFTYDGQNRLIAVRTQDVRGAVEARFEYDSIGRRIAKTDTSFDVRGVKLRSETKRFVWEGLRLAQEVRETGVSSYVYSPDASYSPAARVDAVIAEALAAAAIDTAKRASRIYHFHADLVGAPLEVTDEAGDLAWAGQYTAWGKVEPSSRELTAARTDQPLRYAGQYADESTGLHYNTFRFYDPDVGRFINHDPIGLMGGDNLYAYAPNPTGWIDPWGWFGEKPLNSPDVTKWLDKGGTVHVEVESGTWVYTNAKGTVVRYPNGYPDFSPHAVRSVDVEGLQGNHSKAPTGDFGKADAKAGSVADYKNNTWNHHENMVTMQEVPKDIHGEFTHRGGVSNLKSQPSC